MSPRFLDMGILGRSVRVSKLMGERVKKKISLPTTHNPNKKKRRLSHPSTHS